MDRVISAADEAQRREPLQRVLHKSDLGPRIAGASAPVSLMLIGQAPHERVQLARRAAGSVVRTSCQIFGDEQGDVTVSADLWHPHIGQLIARVDHRDSFGADLGDEAGPLADPFGQRRALRR